MTAVQKVLVSQAESGQKLIQFLSRRLEGDIPRSALMRWIRTGQVRVDRARSKPFVRVCVGQEIRIPPYVPQSKAPISPQWEANPFVLSTVFEDDNFLVLAKPPGLATQPGTGLKDSVHDRLLVRYPASRWRPSLVHRLDKETSGLLLVAKSYAYLQHLQGLLKQRQIRKVYLAWVSGSVSWPNWVRLEDNFTKMGQKGKSAGKDLKAESYAKTLHEQDGLTLVALRLITGRKHQIRIQLATRGFPVIGDPKYGVGRSGQGLLLHAFRLQFDSMHFELPPPWTGRFTVSGKNLEKL